MAEGLGLMSSVRVSRIKQVGLSCSSLTSAESLGSQKLPCFWYAGWKACSLRHRNVPAFRLSSDGDRCGGCHFGGSSGILIQKCSPYQGMHSMKLGAGPERRPVSVVCTGTHCENTLPALEDLIRRDNAGELAPGPLVYVEFDVHVSGTPSVPLP